MLLELEGFARDGLLRNLEGFARPGVHTSDAKGETLLSFATNDYLGLAEAPLTAPGAPSAAASRLVTGTLQEHDAAERELASHVGQPAALLFTAGYAANVGTLAALLGPDDLVLSDALNHASLIDGVRLSPARATRYPHLDLDTVEHHLARRPRDQTAWVISETLFSMDGDAPDLPALHQLCERYGAHLYLDEAHSYGVCGPEGAGLCAAYGIRPDVLLGTLGKAMGLQGAFIASSIPVRDYLVHRARSFVFSTGLSPLIAASVPDRVKRIRRMEKERQHAHALCARLREGLQQRGWSVLGGPGLVTSVVIGDANTAVRAAEDLRRQGIVAKAIRPPTVPEGTSRLRLVVGAAHVASDIERLLESLGAAGSR